MNKSELQATHRKCFACGHTTIDLNNSKCSKCGGYLHMVGQIYSPKVVTDKNK